MRNFIQTQDFPYPRHLDQEVVKLAVVLPELYLEATQDGMLPLCVILPGDLKMKFSNLKSITFQELCGVSGHDTFGEFEGSFRKL